MISGWIVIGTTSNLAPAGMAPGVTGYPGSPGVAGVPGSPAVAGVPGSPGVAGVPGSPVLTILVSSEAGIGGGFSPASSAIFLFST